LQASPMNGRNSKMAYREWERPCSEVLLWIQALVSPVPTLSGVLEEPVQGADPQSVSAPQPPVVCLPSSSTSFARARQHALAALLEAEAAREQYAEEEAGRGFQIE
jgi:hypothetical protein